MTPDKNSKKSSNSRPPKFNTYWIWAGILLIFLGINFFGDGKFSDPKTISTSTFEKYLKEGDVAKIEIIHHKTAKVYLTKEAKEKEEHKKAENRSLLPGMESPDYTFELGDLSNFEDKYDKIV